MKQLVRLLALPCILLLAALLPVGAGVRAQAVQPLLVIVGNQTGISDISLALLRRAFQGDPAEYTWGKRLIPFNHPNKSEERTWFDRVVLGLEPSQVGRFWIDRRIRDEGQPPRTLPSADLAVKIVASLPGAITYVSPSMVTPNVRVLTVDGRSASDPDYAFARR